MAAADRHRLAPERRVVALLDRRVEGVHVDMDDLADSIRGLVHRLFLASSAVQKNRRSFER
jgi:hypothetical protein